MLFCKHFSLLRLVTSPHEHKFTKWAATRLISLLRNKETLLVLGSYQSVEIVDLCHLNFPGVGILGRTWQNLFYLMELPFSVSAVQFRVSPCPDLPTTSTWQVMRKGQSRANEPGTGQRRENPRPSLCRYSQWHVALQHADPLFHELSTTNTPVPALHQNTPLPAVTCAVLCSVGSLGQLRLETVGSG